jgi:hypothetical protein
MGAILNGSVHAAVRASQHSDARRGGYPPSRPYCMTTTGDTMRNTSTLNRSGIFIGILVGAAALSLGACNKPKSDATAADGDEPAMA